MFVSSVYKQIADIAAEPEKLFFNFSGLTNVSLYGVYLHAFPRAPHTSVRIDRYMLGKVEQWAHTVHLYSSIKRYFANTVSYPLISLT